MKKSILKDILAELPQNPGVYFFRDRSGELLYIGKATNLRSRVSSYFRDKQSNERPIETMIHQVADIKVQETDSVLEALILETNLIKKMQPKYNVLEKDDKSFAYFVITKEEYARVLIVRKTDIDFKKLEAKSPARNTTHSAAGGYKLQAVYGPYISKYQMQVALKIIRRIFPFHALTQKSEKGCLDFQLGMCPGPYDGAISKEDYKKNIRGIRYILEGKKKSLLKTLEKEMKAAAKKHEFEKAADLRNKIFALEHIRDMALITKEFESDEFSKKLMPKKLIPVRIEAYDISNISGQNSVGSMVVFENGKPNKSQYRKFKIKTVEGSDDVGSMREVLLRRFKNDWKFPDLVLLDGGVGHLNMAKKLLHEELGLAVDVVAVAKGPTRKNLNIETAFIQDTKYKIQNIPHFDSENKNVEINKILKDKLLIKSIMDEAHRFAITYHRKSRRKEFLR